MKYDEVGMKVAEAYSKLSTCCRKNVGVAILDEKGHTISTGYNGVPAGMKHCNEVFTKEDIKDPRFMDKHLSFSKKYEIHAEANAIITAGKLGSDLSNATLYTTLSPCQDCTKMIIASGIKRVVYRDLYDREHTCLEVLRDAGIKIEKYEEIRPSFEVGPFIVDEDWKYTCRNVYSHFTELGLLPENKEGMLAAQLYVNMIEYEKMLPEEDRNFIHGLSSDCLSIILHVIERFAGAKAIYATQKPTGVFLKEDGSKYHYASSLLPYSTSVSPDEIVIIFLPALHMLNDGNIMYSAFFGCKIHFPEDTSLI